MTTKTVEETRRALFEAAYLKQYFFPAERWSLVPEKYRTQHAEIAWWAFNAALDVVEIELPAPISEHNTDSNGFVNPAAEEYDGCLDDCRAAIESTNLGITVK